MRMGEDRANAPELREGTKGGKGHYRSLTRETPFSRPKHVHPSPRHSREGSKQTASHQKRKECALMPVQGTEQQSGAKVQSMSGSVANTGRAPNQRRPRGLHRSSFSSLRAKFTTAPSSAQRDPLRKVFSSPWRTLV